MGSKAVIIYASASKIVRRIFTSDDDAALVAVNRAGPGETSLLVDRGQKFDLSDARAAIKAQTGIDSPDLCCAILDQNNKVEHVICADPALDTVPGKTVVEAYAGVSVKSTYDPATKLFSDPVVIIPAGTLDKEGNPLTKPIVTGGIIPKPALKLAVKP